MKLALFVAGILSITVGLATDGIAAPLPERTLPQSQSATGATPIDATYTLGAGDRVRIEVFQMPQYTGENTVLADGTLNLPVVGSISVQGLTLEQAAAAISARYATILRRPIVTVNLIAPGPLQVGIAGEVKRPGSYTITRETAQLPTVTQLLQTAGGVQQSADLRRVEIRRLQSSGKEQTINVDLWEFLQTGDLHYDTTLRNGDTVYVPTAENANLAESPLLANASFTPNDNTPINIAVVGEVYRPGPYSVTGTARTAEAGVPGGSAQLGLPPTVTRAIQVAGGIKPTANIRQIEIHRATRTGSEQVINVNLWELLQDGDLSQDAILQDRDTVVIPVASTIDNAEANEVASASFSPDTIRVNVVGEVPRPGVVEVPPNTPLNQALLAAGGFNNRADKKVDLIRLNQNGTVSRQKIGVNFSQNINDQTNPALRNNDVVVVHRSGVAVVSDALGLVTNPIALFFSLFSTPLNFFRLF